MDNVIIVRYGEIFLKGKNFKYFEDKLFDYDNSSRMIGYEEYTEFAELEDELRLEDEDLFNSFFGEEEE